MLGYHFTGETLRDGRPLPPIGEWLEHEGPVVPCESGLHASEHPFDALRYAPGPMLHQVELDGDLQSHGEPIDKWCGRRRRILASIDATPILWSFARWCAIQVIGAWDAPDVVRRYLETGDEALRSAARSAAEYAARYAAESAARYAARSAAWYAARSAARYAAEYAARYAAESAARSAAESAARYAAEYAARYAAESAARSAAESAARSAAEYAARSAAESAAWYAARSAARSAAGSAQRAKFLELVEAAFTDH